jgi:hypothetical protein
MNTELRQKIEALIEYIFETEGENYDEYLQENEDGSDHVYAIAAEIKTLLEQEP